MTAGVASAEITISGGGYVGFNSAPAVDASAGYAAALATATAALTAYNTALAAVNAAGAATAAEVAALVETEAALAVANAALAAQTAATAASTTFDSRFQLNIDGSVTSDSGLSVAARVRIRTSEGALTAVNTPRVTVSTGGLTVAMGNADGAIIQQTSPWNSCVGNLGDYCLSNTWQLAVAQYSSNGGVGADTIRADLSLGGASISVSSDVGNDNGVEVAASTSMGALSVGAGFNLDTNISVLNIQYSADGITAGVRASDAATNIVGLYANYTSGPLTISAFADDTDASALGVSYDLGGGVQVGGAVDNSQNMQAHISFGF